MRIATLIHAHDHKGDGDTYWFLNPDASEREVDETFNLAVNTTFAGADDLVHEGIDSVLSERMTYDGSGTWVRLRRMGATGPTTNAWIGQP